MIGKRIREQRKLKRMTLEDLAIAVGTSKQTIQRYESGVIANIPNERIVAIAKALETSPSNLLGWSERGDLEYSSIRGLSKLTFKKLPMLGTISCGKPIYADEEYESFASADSSIDADFCLRANGDSMIGSRIYDGDMVFIRSQSSVDNGEIAAVIINDEATLKRVYYYPEESKLILSAENPKYAPLVYINDELDSIKILGKAVAFQSNLN